MDHLSITVGVYVAPEIYKNEIFDRGVDSFSFGLILYEVCQNHNFFLFPPEMKDHRVIPYGLSKSFLFHSLSFRSVK